MFLFQKLNKEIDLSLNMAGTGDNPSSDEGARKKGKDGLKAIYSATEPAVEARKHLSIKRTQRRGK